MVLQLQKRSARLGIAGIFVLIALTVIGLQTGKTHLASVKKQAATSAAAKQNKLSAAPAKIEDPTQKSLIEPEIPAPKAEPTAPETPAAQPQTADTTSCNLNIASKLNAYRQDIKKERNGLDASISGPMVGVNVLRQYTADYNEDAAKLFNHYKESFERAGCVFPVSAPELLPSTYPY
jgi:hypothetical protein